mmetsp:Transcript_18066/g.43741  ORF Transcript_18066/g.43741 Transcript_18066/m.43741 type:complete len:266 (+) Transcript_18066:48-845(+)
MKISSSSLSAVACGAAIAVTAIIITTTTTTEVSAFQVKIVKPLLSPSTSPTTTATTTTTVLFGGSTAKTGNGNAAAAAIANANAISQQFGASSKEAALAWEAVEEIDSRDNSAAYTTDTSKVMTAEELREATSQYETNLKTVQRLTRDLKKAQKHMKDVATQLQALKIQAPENRPAPKSLALDKALQDAKSASIEYGKSSPEARLAWEDVEEIASAGLSSAFEVDDMTDECLLEAAEICLALEELDRFINYEKITEDESGGLGCF